MQKIRNQFHRPLALTGIVVGSGMILFLTGVFLLVMGTATRDIQSARLNFIGAGWVLTLGWILKRAEDRQWPFQSHLAWPVGSSKPASTIILLAIAVGLGTNLWRYYGPTAPETAPRPLAFVGVSDASSSRTQDVFPGADGTLSLTWPATASLQLATSRYRSVAAPIPAGKQAIEATALFGDAAALQSPAPRAFHSAVVVPGTVAGW